MQRNNYFTDRVDDNLFDTDYIALLQIASVCLEIYSIEHSEKQNGNNQYMLHMLENISERMDRIEGQNKKIERLLERRLYND